MLSNQSCSAQQGSLPPVDCSIAKRARAYLTNNELSVPRPEEDLVAKLAGNLRLHVLLQFHAKRPFGLY